MDHTITALKAQKRNPERINVYLDGNYAFAVARIVGAWLQVGQVISDEKIVAMQTEDTREKAYLRAVKFAGYRPRSEAEVRKKLTEVGFADDVVEETVNRLRENGLLSDERFARDWVDNRATFKPRSRRVIAMELRQKGVADEIIQDALDEAVDEDKLAYQAALRRARRWAGLDWATFRERLSAYLLRLGFSYGTISDLVHQVWTDLRSEQEDGATSRDTDRYEDENG